MATVLQGKEHFEASIRRLSDERHTPKRTVAATECGTSPSIELMAMIEELRDET